MSRRHEGTGPVDGGSAGGAPALSSTCATSRKRSSSSAANAPGPPASAHMSSSPELSTNTPSAAFMRGLSKPCWSANRRAPQRCLQKPRSRAKGQLQLICRKLSALASSVTSHDELPRAKPPKRSGPVGARRMRPSATYCSPRARAPWVKQFVSSAGIIHVKSGQLPRPSSPLRLADKHPPSHCPLQVLPLGQDGEALTARRTIRGEPAAVRRKNRRDVQRFAEGDKP